MIHHVYDTVIVLFYFSLLLILQSLNEGIKFLLRKLYLKSSGFGAYLEGATESCSDKKDVHKKSYSIKLDPTWCLKGS